MQILEATRLGLLHARILLRAAAIAFVAMVGAEPAGAAEREAGPSASPLQLYASCIVDRQLRPAEALVRSEPGTAEEAASSSPLEGALRACGKQLAGREPPERAMLRGLIAEQLWLRSVWMLGGHADPVDPNKVDFDSGFDAAVAHRDDYRVAFCVAYTHAVDVDDLLRTVPASPSERLAFDTLTPAISHCLAHGRTLALGRPWLRALLAEQLYRIYRPTPRNRAVP